MTITLQQTNIAIKFPHFQSLGIQSYSQMMIGVSNHLLSIVFRFHYHSQKVIGSLGNRKYIFKWWIFHCCVCLPECKHFFFHSKTRHTSHRKPHPKPELNRRFLSRRLRDKGTSAVPSVAYARGEKDGPNEGSDLMLHGNTWSPSYKMDHPKKPVRSKAHFTPFIGGQTVILITPSESPCVCLASL